MRRSLVIALFAAALILVDSQRAAADISNGQNASGVIGQSVERSATPSFTQNGPNNGPNSFGVFGVLGMALDPVGHRLFVGDSANNRVLVFNLANNNSLTNYQADNVLGQANLQSRASALSQTGLSRPVGLGFDQATQRLYVTDQGNNRVLIYDVTAITDGEPAVNVLGQQNFTTDTEDVSAAGMYDPTGLALDTAGSRLFVVDTQNKRVLVFNTAVISDGEAAVAVLGQEDFTSFGANQDQDGFVAPFGVAFTTAGNRLFVSDRNPNRVMVFDVGAITNGEDAVNVLGQADFTSGGFGLTIDSFDGPLGVAIDTAGQLLYVNDSQNSRVMVFDVNAITDGEDAVSVLGQPDFVTETDRTGQNGLNTPGDGLFYSPDTSQLFVGDGNDRVMIFDVTAITNGENAVNVLGAVNDFAAPTPVFDLSGPNSGPNLFGMRSPREVAVDTANHRLFVADSLNSRVLVFNLSTDNRITDTQADNVLGQPDFASRTSNVTQSGLTEPGGVAYDAAGNRLFVADGVSRILVFDVASITDGENAVNVLGQADFVSSGFSTTQSTLSGVGPIAYDSAGSRLFAADRSNDRVMIFDVAAIANGENAVNVLGQADFTSSVTATTQSGFDRPEGIDYDAAGKRLFVGDIGNNRVMVFDIDSITDGENAVNVLGQPDFVTGASNITQNGLFDPQDVAFDPATKRLFVANDARVSVFDVEAITNGEDAAFVLGQSSFTGATITTTQAGMDLPFGLFSDSAGKRLWVADRGSNRVTTYDFENTPTPTPTPTATSTPVPTPQNFVTLIQSGRVRSGVANLRVFTDRLTGDVESQIPNVKGTVTCKRNRRSTKVGFTTNAKGAAKLRVSNQARGAKCRAQARIDGKNVRSDQLKLR